MNGTLLEQPSIFQGVIAFLAMIYYIYARDRKRTIMTGIFWAASVIAFLVMFLSPGTSIRMSSVAGAQSILQRTLRGILVAGVHGFFTAIKFFAKPIVYVPLLFLPVISSKISKITLKAWHIVIITSLIAPAMQMLQSWSMGTGFPDRAVSLTLWSMGFTWCILWIFFYNGRLTKPSLASKYRWLALIIAIIISANSIDVINDLRIAPAYRQEQQARAEIISSQAASGVEDIIVPKITNRPAMIYSDLGVAPDRTCAAYYGAQSVMALPEAMMKDREAIATLRSGSLAPLKPYAEAGDSDLQALLGWSSDPIYKTSNINNGLEVSLDEAERWDRMGAENGNLLCMRALSRVLYTRDKSIMQAMYWLLKYQLATIRL